MLAARHDSYCMRLRFTPALQTGHGDAAGHHVGEHGFSLDQKSAIQDVLIRIERLPDAPSAVPAGR
jgi:hypothetical protein